MKIEQFAEKILKEVKNKAEGDFKVQITRAVKNNGIKLTGISASGPGAGGGPCVYLNDYYQEYMDGKTGINEAAMDIYRNLAGHMDDIRGIDLSGFCQWDKTKDHIYAKLVNAEMNRELLADVPHRKFLDLAVIYYVEVDGITNGHGTASFTVENRHMEAWGQAEENLYPAACSNMRTSGPPLFKNMNEVMREMIQDEVPFADVGDLPDSKMYVLTNRKKLFGAAELLDGDTLKEIGDKLGSDYMVLPSSLHECIIVPSEEGMSYSEFADIVKGVNREQVVMEESLSDHVYLYDREKGVLEIAA